MERTLKLITRPRTRSLSHRNSADLALARRLVNDHTQDMLQELYNRIKIEHHLATSPTNLSQALKNLEAVINFSALQRLPLEQAGCMNASSRISMKYFSDFYISYRRGIGAGTETPDHKGVRRLLWPQTYVSNAAMGHSVKLEVVKLLTAKRGFALWPRRLRDRKKLRPDITFSALGARL